MKKSIIAAGAASVALAAMPIFGAFASTASVTDNLEVVLDPTCTLTRTGADGTGDQAGTWNADDQKYSATMAAGTTANLGTSTFSITCNDTTNGHQLAVAVSGLTGASKGGSIAYDGTKDVANTDNTWNITTSANATLGVSAGKVNVTDSKAFLYGGENKNTTAVEKQTFTASYNVGTKSTLAADTYSGTAIYTLTYGS